METQVEDFNWNLRLFLDVLTSYQTKVNKASPVTLELLEKTLDSISDLIGNVEEVTASQGDAIVCSFDETQFEIKRTIFCWICKVDIAASRINYLLHLADPKHNANLIGTQKKSVPAQNGVSDTNKNSNSNKGASVNLSAKRNDAPFQRPNVRQNASQNAKETGNSNSNSYIGNMADLIASLKINDVGKTRDLQANNGNRNATVPNKGAVPKAIPNVFDDNIYDFLESIGKQGDPTEMIELSQANAPQKQNEPSKANSKYGVNKGDAIKKVSPESDQLEVVRQNSLLSWRERLNEPVPPPHVEQWRAKKDGSVSVTQIATSTPTTNKASATTAAKPNTIAKVFPTPVTESIIQNGAVVTAAGVKPCATYDLNNLYIKFPHLNPDKVANPLKPVPLKDVKRVTDSNNEGKTQKVTDPKLKDFFDKVNREYAKKTQEQFSSGPLKKTEMTNSLSSLPAFPNSNLKATAEQQVRNRMPPRSASSFSLTGISRLDGSNPQKGNRKSSPHVSGQNRNTKNQNGNNRNQNSNGKAKGTQGQNGSSSLIPSDISKGAIPKQPNKNTPQASTSNQKASNDSTTSNQSSQNKDTKNEPSKTTDLGTEPKELTAVVKDEQLKKFFSGDLSALINLMVNLNLRQEKIAVQQKVLESIENMLKTKFTKIKCHMIGSHVYNIAKGGLATLDVYLDLYDSFHTDKSGPIFVNGMNDVMKLMSQNNDEWSDAKCSGQTRYDILSVTHKATNLKCSLTFGTGVGVRNSNIVNSLFDAQPVARQMAICVRLALQEGANGDWTKHFSGYVVALLVIFYLQVAGKLPSVLTLQTTDPTLEPMKCGENLVHFKKPTNVIICKDRIRDLLIGFFDYYEKFDFFNKIISPYEGREINQNFRNCPVDSMSRSMRRFKSLIDTETYRWTNNRMCVQDIFEHKRNVTQAIHTKEIKAFADLCGKALLAIRDAGNSVKY